MKTDLNKNADLTTSIKFADTIQADLEQKDNEVLIPGTTAEDLNQFLDNLESNLLEANIQHFPSLDTKQKNKEIIFQGLIQSPVWIHTYRKLFNMIEELKPQIKQTTTRAELIKLTNIRNKLEAYMMQIEAKSIHFDNENTKEMLKKIQGYNEKIADMVAFKLTPEQMQDLSENSEVETEAYIRSVVNEKFENINRGVFVFKDSQESAEQFETPELFYLNDKKFAKVYMNAGIRKLINTSSIPDNEVKIISPEYTMLLENQLNQAKLLSKPSRSKKEQKKLAITINKNERNAAFNKLERLILSGEIFHKEDKKIISYPHKKSQSWFEIDPHQILEQFNDTAQELGNLTMTTSALGWVTNQISTLSSNATKFASEVSTSLASQRVNLFGFFNNSSENTASEQNTQTLNSRALNKMNPHKIGNKHARRRSSMEVVLDNVPGSIF